MTSTTANFPRKIDPWRIKRLPTFPVSLSPTYFFNLPKNKKLQIQNYPTFTARIRPIKQLKFHPCPHHSGSIILRAFLYAREKWPTVSFRNVVTPSLEAVYESFRRDGLPRVVFVASKEVEQPLRGKLTSVLRHRFKRRAKLAFKMALEGIRREKEGILML